MSTPEWSALTQSIKAAAPLAFALVVVLPDGTVRWGADYSGDLVVREAIIKWMRHMHLEAKRLKARGLGPNVIATMHQERYIP